jgi:hypothetical protein
MNDVEGGGLYYWPHGPDVAPEIHETSMANTALVGDNHGMFHQVAPIGPFDRGTVRITPMAELRPAAVDADEWVVIDHGEEVLRTTLERCRVSVLWKADVYRTAAERDAAANDRLSMEDVAAAFNDDLARRGSRTRFDTARVDDPSMKAELAAVYPEATPVGALRSALA